MKKKPAKKSTAKKRKAKTPAIQPTPIVHPAQKQIPLQHEFKLRAAPLKIVTMCQGGQVRSVGLKFRLTYKHGHEVIACGWQSNTPETRAMLFKWADYIIIMQQGMDVHIPKEFHTTVDGRRKLFCFDVGPDNFGNPFHPRLQQMLDGMINAHGVFNKP